MSTHAWLELRRKHTRYPLQLNQLWVHCYYYNHYMKSFWRKILVESFSFIQLLHSLMVFFVSIKFNQSWMRPVCSGFKEITSPSSVSSGLGWLYTELIRLWLPGNLLRKGNVEYRRVDCLSWVNSVELIYLKRKETMKAAEERRRAGKAEQV
jgi:hypothetical protein